MTIDKFAFNLHKDLLEHGVKVSEATLRQILSTYGLEEKKTEFVIGNVSYDAVRQMIGNTHLSNKENRVLHILALHEGEEVERSYILQRVWKGDTYFHSRSLSVYINHLKKILAVEAPSAQIFSMHGRGYKMLF